MHTGTNISVERFSQGLPVEQFVKEMQLNKEAFLESHDSFTLTRRDSDTLNSFQSPLKVLVLAEEWCGDVLRYLPALWKMSEATAGWEVRVFYRDDNPDLAELWLKEGKYRAIPVMVFFDGQMNELACYVEKPALVNRADELAKEAFVEEHGELQDAAMPYGEMSEPTRRLYTSFVRAYRMKMRDQWQQMFADEVLAKLLQAGVK